MERKKYKQVEYPEIKRAPKISHAKENIIQVLIDFNNATGKRDAKIILHTCNRGKGIYEDEKYLLIKQQKTPLTAAKYNPIDKWHTVRESVFNCLVDLLHDFDCLTLKDDRLLYQSNCAVFHSLNYLYGNDPDLDFESLAGEYRTFNVGLLDNDVITKGHLIIEYIEDGNYLQTKHIASHKNNTGEFIYEYTGVITFYRNTKYLIMKDIPTQKSSDYGNNYRISRLYITKKDKEGKIFEGATWLDTGSNNIKRKFFIDNYLDEEPEPNEKSISIDRYNNTLPPRYKKALEDDEVLEFSLSPVLG